jgi:ATP-dependent protease ClpP protease subunit
MSAHLPAGLPHEARYVLPHFIERTSQGVREYDPYAKLFEERIIFLGVQIDDASGTKGKRLALPNSRILIHQPYTETGRADLNDLEIQANEILRMRALLEHMLAKHSGRTEEQVRDDIERDKILTAAQAVEYGLIDQVISSRAEGMASEAR